MDNKTHAKRNYRDHQATRTQKRHDRVDRSGIEDVPRTLDQKDFELFIAAIREEMID
jgi:hypothetical protein